MEGDYVEAVEQVFAKVSAFNLLVEILVGGGDDTNVHLDRFGGADGLEALFVERTQHFCLSLKAHVGDFVEKQGAAVGLLELADFVHVGSREAAFAMAEQFVLDQVLGNGRAVYFDEWLGGALASGVDGSCDQFFPGAAFAVNQDASVGGGHESELLAEGLHRDAFADDAGLVAAF